jgi:purine-binding chemotaxis protein CheW
MDIPRVPTQALLLFHFSGLDCAFPLDSVREIVPMAQLSVPPGLPSGIAGFLNLRGTAVPIVRLDRLFDLPEQQPGLHTPMIVLHGSPGPTGILVNDVCSIVQVPAEQLVDIPGDRTFQGCATGALRLDGEVIHVLSPAALLQVSEARVFADYAVIAQARLLHT